MTSTAEHLFKTAANTLYKKGQQMNHMEEQFLENCRTCVYDKLVTPLIIDVALGRQDAGRDKVAGFRTGKPIRPQRPQTLGGKPEPQAKTPTPLKEVINLLTLAQKITSALPWIPMMRAGRPAPAARFVPHCSPVMGVQPITGEWPRPGGKASCL